MVSEFQASQFGKWRDRVARLRRMDDVLNENEWNAVDICWHLMGRLQDKHKAEIRRLEKKYLGKTYD